jgi:hypothetical protein
VLWPRTRPLLQTKIVYRELQVALQQRVQVEELQLRRQLQQGRVGAELMWRMQLPVQEEQGRGQKVACGSRRA